MDKYKGFATEVFKKKERNKKECLLFFEYYCIFLKKEEDLEEEENIYSFFFTIFHCFLILPYFFVNFFYLRFFDKSLILFPSLSNQTNKLTKNRSRRKIYLEKSNSKKKTDLESNLNYTKGDNFFLKTLNSLFLSCKKKNVNISNLLDVINKYFQSDNLIQLLIITKEYNLIHQYFLSLLKILILKDDTEINLKKEFVFIQSKLKKIIKFFQRFFILHRKKLFQTKEKNLQEKKEIQNQLKNIGIDVYLNIS